MARARRQPPLFEFLDGSDRRASPSAAPESPLRKPVEVPVPRLVTGDTPPRSNAGASHGSASHTLPRKRPFLFWGGFAIAGVALLGLVVWNLAYRSGRLDEQQKLRNFVAPDPTAAGGGAGRGVNAGSTTGPNLGQTPPVKVLPSQSGSSTPGASGPEVAERPAETPAGPDTSPPVMPPSPPGSADMRRTGVNYLELATLTYRDAVQATEFLSRSGVKAAMAPSQRGVDPAKAAANNAPHVVFVAEGVPSERFRASEGERKRLEDRVEQLGKRYQRELKGPTDFSRPMWRLYREKASD